MCGRMNITDNEGILILMDMIGMPTWSSIQARYNVSPTATIDTLHTREGDTPEVITQTQMRWGLIPPWAKDGQFKRPLINARSETVREKPSFRHLVNANRCLVPVTGFYEWKREGKSKRPFYIFPTTGNAMFFGGLYQLNSAGNPELTLLTTAANDSMSAVHDRMPVIIEPADAMQWLSPSDGDSQSEKDLIDTLMQPAGNDVLEMYEVSAFVSNARNEGAQCTEPYQPQRQTGLDL